MRRWVWTLLAHVTAALVLGAAALPDWGPSEFARWVGTYEWQATFAAGDAADAKAPSADVIRALPATFARPDGALLLLAAPRTVYVLQPVEGVWDAPMPAPMLDRVAPAACTSPDGTRWFVFGGATADGAALLDDLWTFDANPEDDTEEWTHVAGNATHPANTAPSDTAPGARRGANLLCTSNNVLLLFGGAVRDGDSLATINDVWQIDVRTGVWQRLVSGARNSPGAYGTRGEEGADNRPPAREFASAWFLDGSAYIFGGETSALASLATPTPDPASLLGDFWRFNRTMGSWAWLGCTPHVAGEASVGSTGLACPAARSRATTLVGNSADIWGGFRLSVADSGVPTTVVGFDLWSWDGSDEAEDATRAVTEGVWWRVNFDGDQRGVWLMNTVPVPDGLAVGAFAGAPGWVRPEDAVLYQGHELHVLTTDVDAYALVIGTDLLRWVACMIIIFVVSLTGTMLTFLILPRLVLESDTSRLLEQVGFGFLYVFPSIANVLLDAFFVLLLTFPSSTLRTACIVFQVLPTMVPMMLAFSNIGTFLQTHSLKIPGVGMPGLRENDSVVAYMLLRVPVWAVQSIIVTAIYVTFFFIMAGFYIGCIMAAWLCRLVYLPPFHRPTFGYFIVRKNDSKVADAFDLRATYAVIAIELVLRTFPLLVIELDTIVRFAPETNQTRTVAAFAIMLNVYMLMLGVATVARRPFSS